MRKKGWIIAGSIVGALILLWVVAALVIGGGTKQGIESAFEDARASSSGTISAAELVEYKKGMASSTGKSKFVVGPPNGEGIEIFLNHKIFHGPVMMTPAGLKLGTSHTVTTLDIESLPEAVKENIERGFVSTTPLTINATTGVGSSEIGIEIAEYNNRIKMEDGTSARVVFEGGSGELSGIGGSSSEGEMKLGLLKITSDAGMEVTIEPGTATLNGREMADGMMLDGDVRMAFPRVTFKQEDFNLAVSDLVFSQNSNVSEDDGKAAVTQTMSAGEIRLPKSEEFASAQNLISKGVEWEFSMAKMDIEQLKKMAESAREVQKEQSEAAGDPEAAAKLAMKQMKAGLEMIQPGIEIGLGLDLRGDAGRSTVDIDLKWVSGDPLLQAKTMQEVLGGIKADVKVDLPVALMEDPGMAMVIGMASGSQALIIGEEKIEGAASLIHTTATLNGETFPLKEMLGPMLDMPVDWDALFSGAMIPGTQAPTPEAAPEAAVEVVPDAKTPPPASVPAPPAIPAPVKQPEPVEN